MMKNKVLFLTITMLLIVNFGYSTNLDKTVTANKLENEIVIDGILNESVWKNKPVSNFIQKEPDEGKKATEKTLVWVAYDESYLYVAAKLYDSQPKTIDTKLARRDVMIKTDRFYVSIDSYNDNRTGFYFGVNPAGYMNDGILYNDSWQADSWNAIWEVKTTIDDEGWNAEIKIPLSQLRYNQSDEMVWGINFDRYLLRNNELSFYVMVPNAESGFTSRFPDLVGLNGIKKKKRVEFLPYISTKGQYLDHDDNDPFYDNNQYQFKIGGDIKIGLGSNLTLDATINPDFGQVEADPAQMNLSAFETYFQEKRPFFIEGQNIYQFGQGGANNNWGFNFGTPLLIYSRRIGRQPQGTINYNYDYVDKPTETRILGAGKISGKTKNNTSIGILSALTERTFATIDTGDGTVKQEIEPLTHYGAFRSEKEFNNGNRSLGMMFTAVNRDLSDSLLSNQLAENAYAFGIDGWTFLDKDQMWVLKGNIIGSHVSGTEEYMLDFQKSPFRYMQRPDAKDYILDSNLTSMNGWFSRITLNKQKGNFYLNTAIGAVSPGFSNNDMGFQFSGDKINWHIVSGYRWFKPGKIFRRKSSYFVYTENYDFEFNNIGKKCMTFNNFQFLNYYNLEMEAGYFFKSKSKELTRGGPLAEIPVTIFTDFSLSSDSRKKFVVEAGFEYWAQNDIDSYGNEIFFDIQFKPSSRINIEISPSYSKNVETVQWVGKFEDALATETYGTRYVFSDMTQKTIASQVRLNWTFTPKLSLELFVQPYISVGKYSNFKELAKSNSLDLNNYNEVGTVTEINNQYTIDPDADNPAESFTFYNPDFNYKSFKANMVLRWEVAPGSVFYLVWTNNKADYQTNGELDIAKNSKDLWKSDPDNIFMMKFSYWFDIGNKI